MTKNEWRNEWTRLHYYHPDPSHRLPSPELPSQPPPACLDSWLHSALYSPYYPPPTWALRRKFHETTLFPLLYISQRLKQCLRYLLSEWKSQVTFRSADWSLFYPPVPYCLQRLSLQPQRYSTWEVIGPIVIMWSLHAVFNFPLK